MSFFLFAIILGSSFLFSFRLKSTWQVPETQALPGKDILANHLTCKVEARRQKMDDLDEISSHKGTWVRRQYGILEHGDIKQESR